MAAATILAEESLEVMGHSLVKHYRLDDVADTNTLVVAGMTSIKSIQITFADAAAVAADSVAATASGNTITFQTAGAARDLWVTVFGTH